MIHAMLFVALACLAGAAAAPTPAPAACESKYLYRYISQHKYPDGVNATDAEKLEVAALKACSLHFERGGVGADLGIGPSIFGPNGALNWHLGKILDFANQTAVSNYYKCMDTKNVAKSAKKVKWIYQVPSCDTAAVAGPVVHLYAYNLTGKVYDTKMYPTFASYLTMIDSNVDMLVYKTSCFIPKSYNGQDVGWASKFDDPENYYPYGGEIEFWDVNGVRGFWAYALGPPTQGNLANITASITNSMRMQLNYNKVK